MELFGVLWLLLVLIVIFFKHAIGMVTALGGILGLYFLTNYDVAMKVAGAEPYEVVTNVNMVAIPLFVLMGIVIGKTGLGADLYYAASKWLGHVRGGLAMASMFAAGVFAAVCSNSIITAMTIGKIAYPEMKRYKFKDSFAAGAIAAGGTVGVLIPPSIGFIIYGLLTETSIGKLFMAGIVPGILQVLFYVITCAIICRFRPDWGPAAPPAPMKEKFSSLSKTLPVLILVVIIIGGMYKGVFTPTEAGGIGASGAIILSLLSGKLTKKNLRESVVEATQNTAMVIVLIIGINILMRFLTVSQVTIAITDWIAGLGLSHHMILAVIVLLYIIFGFFMDIWACIMLTVPILYPVVISLGFDPIWFGVLVVRLIEIGLITPPFGLNGFVLSSAINVPIGTIFKGIWPFLVADACHIILLIAVPGICLLFN